MHQQREQKREKLIQYGKRVWNLSHNNDDALIDAAIAATKNFFEKMGVPTTFKGYGLDGSSIPALVDNVIRHNPNPLGEHADITAEITREILLAAA
jgi:NADP-dependent alcohol dehydrogenase